MTDITFIYGNNQFKKKCKDKNELIIDILLEYSSIINKDIKELYFISNGKKISYKNKEKIKDLKKNKINIFVLNLNNKKESNELDQIVCPECKEMAIMKFDQDKIIISNCIKNHIITNISINELIESQNINELRCNICNNDKYLYNNKFYICSCKKTICPLCARSHEKTHTMIEYNNRFYKCIQHNKNFLSYCQNCNMNLCETCEKNHNKKHKIIEIKNV